MFERFTDRSRRVLVLAQEEAVRTRHFISAEHFLFGIIEDGGGLAYAALNDAGVTVDTLRAAAAVVHPPGPAVSTSDALASLGIDAQAVKASVEESFPEAVVNVPNDERPAFSVEGKNVLAQSLRQAVEMQRSEWGDSTGTLDSAHLLLGVLVTAPNNGTKVLAELGVDAEALRRRIVGGSSG